MKKKINRQLIFISVLAVGITLLMMAAVFYRIFQIQVIEDLRLFTHALAQSGETELVMLSADRMEENAQEEVSGTVEPEKEMSGANVSETDKADRIGDSVRITLISAAGQVLYDSNASTGGMDNHAERPEVRDVLKNGEGYSIRQSSTMRKNTFYYTMRLEDGNVLRVAREAHSLWSILYRSVPALMAAVCALLALCMFLSHYLTKSLLMPIERMAADMDCMEEQDVYEELRPFSRTIRRQHEAILKNADVRQEFSANVSHELKTPLTAIIGYADMLRSRKLDEEKSLLSANYIYTEGKRLEAMSIRLLDIMVTRHGQAQFQEVQAENLFLYLRDMFKTNESMQFVYSYDKAVVWVESNLIITVLINLLDNACKASEPGSLIEVMGSSGEEGYRFTIKDHGMGIPEKELAKITKAFYMVDKSRSRSRNGAGLGLALCTEILSLHGSSLEIASRVGEGTSISFVIPDRGKEEGYEEIHH